MKALTLTQPWASLMALQEKQIETRSWSTGYRGELVIHSSKSFPKHERWLCEQALFREALRGARADELPLSRGLCVVRLVACIKSTDLHKLEAALGHKASVNELMFGNYEPGRYAWVTEFVRPLDNVGLVKGSLGLWEWAESDQGEGRERIAARGGATMSKAPEHPCEVTIRIGANETEYVAGALREIQETLDRSGIAGAMSGGWSGSWSVDVRKRDITAEQYRDELEAWRQEEGGK